MLKGLRVIDFLKNYFAYLEFAYTCCAEELTEEYDVGFHIERSRVSRSLPSKENTYGSKHETAYPHTRYDSHLLTTNHIMPKGINDIVDDEEHHRRNNRHTQSALTNNSSKRSTDKEED